MLTHTRLRCWCVYDVQAVQVLTGNTTLDSFPKVLICATLACAAL